jgi:putative intracellular protease/amidase
VYKIILILCLFLNLTYTEAKIKNVLIVVTSHSELGATGVKTGYYLSEVAHPYHEFKKAGFKVDIASIKGGKAPVDPKSLNLKDLVNKEFWENDHGEKILSETLKLSEVNASDYGVVFFAGGHGAMWDFSNATEVSDVSAAIYDKGGIVAAVCHGPAALVNIKLKNGDYLVKGIELTAFSNAEEEAAGLTKIMPFLLETKLVERGAKFSKADLWQEKVVVSQRLVTGQNPASAAAVAKAIVSGFSLLKTRLD